MSQQPPTSRRPPSRFPAPPNDMYSNGHLRETARAEIAVLLGRAHPSLQVPEQVGAYYNLLPLDHAPRSAFGRGGPPIMSYKAVSAARGTATNLLRVVGTSHASSTQIVRTGEVWRRVRHPILLCMKEVFTTQAFGMGKGHVPINEVVWAYEFANRADTLYNVFLAGGEEPKFYPLAESTIWAIATQLLSVLACVHGNRLSLRESLSGGSVLVTGRNRVRVSCVGLADAYDQSGVDHLPTAAGVLVEKERAAIYQKADLANLGSLLAVLALRVDPKIVRGGMLLVSDDVAIEAMRRLCSYSDDLIMLVATLKDAARPGNTVTTANILGMVGPRMALELGNVWSHCDALQSKLFVEFDSSRMFRLMGLLGFVNERADGGVDPQWSETGDRYLLKLFRDYVFHRVDSNGRPVLDMAHVVECLSRLDVGAPEQVLLSSRDGSSLLVATYEDLRRCLMQAVAELRGSSQGLPPR